MKIIAIDNGYEGTKIYDGAKEVLIPSRLQEGESGTIGMGRYKVTYNGNQYIVGAGVFNYEMNIDKTKTAFHKILTLTALAQYTEVKEDFKIVAGLPINHYKSQRKGFEEYLKTKEPVQIEVNGETKIINIKDVKCFPQEAAALYSIGADKYKDKRVGVWGWGGGTVDGGIMDNLNLIEESIFTIENGAHSIKTDIAQRINARYSTNIKEESIDNILANDFKLKGETIGIQDIIKKSISKAINAAIRTSKVLGWELDSMDIIHTGGGILMPYMQVTLKEMIPQSTFSNSPVFDNARGLYKVGEVIYK